MPSICLSMIGFTLMRPKPTYFELLEMLLLFLVLELFRLYLLSEFVIHGLNARLRS